MVLTGCTGEGNPVPSLPACFAVDSSPWEPAQPELSSPRWLELREESFAFPLYGPEPLGSLAVLSFASGATAELAWRYSEEGDTLVASFGVFSHYTLTLVPKQGEPLVGELRWDSDGGRSAVSAMQLEPAECATGLVP